MTTKTYLVECHADNAPRFKDWLANRGGIAVWPSINLSTPGASACTPPSPQPASQPPGRAGPTPASRVTSSPIRPTSVSIPRRCSKLYASPCVAAATV